MLYAILLASVLQAGEFHWLELLVLIWIVTFILEDGNQWWNNPVFKWNELFFVVELISLGLYCVGAGLRIAAFNNPTSETLINYTHVALGLSYIGFSIQLLQICYSNEFFGPLMAMFKNMLLKLLKFLVIIFVFFISYAVASESVLYPRAPLNPQLAYYLTRRAFWGMFGEFLLDELESQEGDIDPPTCTNDPTEYSDYSQLRCPTGTGRFFGPVLLGLYFLTVNVLLFNLLIAVFNNEIKRIEQKADGVWKRHALITTLRYHNTLFPPPIFFGLFFPLLKLRLNQERRAPFLKKIASDKKQQLYKVQNEIQEKYMAERMKNDFLTINCRVNCPHIDTPEFEQTFSRPVKGDPLTEESAIAVLTTTRPVFINQKNSKGVLVPQKNRLFAVRTRYKYGLRWDCVKVRPLSTKRRRYEPTADDFSVDVDVGKTYKSSSR
ncbi:transient receptor potential cation channel subfamily M member-like 2 [Physella acuta]|uniref:transient receptor potential cation channel subfamily M member-like 2 n=1 Tax=Physella acuta TaxID=109671 RepID=UPI0027DCEA11|nr:transient receptor potential cation channel subfamily M member-like 2 [Physella acuta]